MLARIWWSGNNVDRPMNLPGENSEMPLRKEAGYETGQAKRKDFGSRR
jgi:hypothetical protein